MKTNGRRIIIYVLVLANGISLFFNFRWAMRYSLLQAVHHFIYSYQSLIISTALSIIALYFLYKSENPAVENTAYLDADLIPQQHSSRFFYLSILLSIIACTLPELLMLL